MKCLALLSQRVTGRKLYAGISWVGRDQIESLKERSLLWSKYVILILLYL